MPEKSLGHLAFIGQFEYFVHNGSVYRVKTANYIGQDGLRVGARFECYESHANEHLAYLRGVMNEQAIA